MKKLYNGKVRRVHPSPPASSPWDFLASLPAAVLARGATLSAEETEVLVYLLSCGDTGFASDRAFGKNSQRPSQFHPPELGCRCFGCYKTFWARWNASPNNHLIHHIIDAVEEYLASQSLPSTSRRSRRSRRKDSADETFLSARAAAEKGSDFTVDDLLDKAYDDDDSGDEKEDDNARSGEFTGGERRSSLGRLVSFIGDRVWESGTINFVVLVG